MQVDRAAGRRLAVLPVALGLRLLPAEEPVLLLPKLLLTQLREERLGGRGQGRGREQS